MRKQWNFKGNPWVMMTVAFLCGFSYSMVKTPYDMFFLIGAAVAIILCFEVTIGFENRQEGEE